MSWATYLTASPHTLDGYYRTEALADARITAAAAENPAVTLSKHGSVSYKLPNGAVVGAWVYDSGETDFVLAGLSDAQRRREWKQELGLKAKMVDDAIRSHWARQTRAQSEWQTDATLDDARRLNNTFDWARMWIGLTWLEILKFEGDAAALALEMTGSTTAALADMAAVEEVFDQMQAELPNHDHIYFWYAAHNPDGSWRTWLDSGNLYATQSDGTGALWKAARYAAIPDATWDAMLITYYGAARSWAAGIGVS